MTPADVYADRDYIRLPKDANDNPTADIVNLHPTDPKSVVPYSNSLKYLISFEYAKLLNRYKVAEGGTVRISLGFSSNPGSLAYADLKHTAQTANVIKIAPADIGIYACGTDWWNCKWTARWSNQDWWGTSFMIKGLVPGEVRIQRKYHGWSWRWSPTKNWEILDIPLDSEGLPVGDKSTYVESGTVRTYDAYAIQVIARRSAELVAIYGPVPGDDEPYVCRSDVAPVSPDSPGPITLKIPTTERTCVIRCERDPGEGHLPCGNITFNASVFNVFNHLDSTIYDRMVGVYAVPSQTWGYAHRGSSYQPGYNGRTMFTIGNYRYTTPWLSPVYDFQLYAIYERKDAEEWPDAPNRSRRIAGALSEPVEICLPYPQGEGIPLIARYNGKYNPDEDGNYAADADLMSPFDAESDIYGDWTQYVPYWELMRGQPTSNSQLICSQIADLDFGPGSLYTTSLASEVSAAISPIDEQGNVTWMASVRIKASEFLAALSDYSGVIYYDGDTAWSYGDTATTISLDNQAVITQVGDFEIPAGAAVRLVPEAIEFPISGAADSLPTDPDTQGP